MKTKNKTILMFILVFAAITLCYSQVLAASEWLDRSIAEAGDDLVCFEEGGWIVCRDDTNGFPEVVGDLLKFNYAVVPSLACDTDNTLCSTWSFFMLYVQDQLANNFFVTTSPKGATLEKDPVPQCGGIQYAGLTGIKWNPKVNFSKFRYDSGGEVENPVFFSITTKMGVVASDACSEPVIVTSSECITGDVPGPKILSGSLELEQYFTCTSQGPDADKIVKVQITYNECSGIPEEVDAQDVTDPNNPVPLSVRPPASPFYYFMREKYPDPDEDPEERAFPGVNTGPYPGATICTDRDYPVFVWKDQAWLVE